MDDEKRVDLRAELAALEEEEAHVSAERRHLHRQIDFGYSSESTRSREREVSDHRRELHDRIDAIRARLGMLPGPKQAPTEGSLDHVIGRIRGLESIVDPTQRIDPPIDGSSSL
jgi:hypothetical protein